MKIMMIDGSPKVSKSNSEYFLNILSDFIESKDIVIKEINTIDTLVFAFPLYVDSLPSHVLEFLIMLEENFKDNLKGVNVYVIVNCGFYEGKQNKIALNIMKCWCKKMNIKWAQGIGIGAGEMMGGLRNVPMGKGPNTNLGLALDNLAKNINENKSGDDIFTTPSMFPRFAFRLAANRFWISKANRNGLKKRDLNKCIVKQ